MKHNKPLKIVLLLSWITYVTAYLCRVNLSTVLDKLSVGLNVSMEFLGIASSVYFVTYAVGQLINGFLGDRVNPHRFIMLALLCTGTINVVLGVQTNAALFPVLWGLNGFCQSMFWSTLLRLLSCYAEEHQRKTVSTLMSISSVTGYLFSWVVLSWIFEPYSHLPYFVVPGALALALIPLWFLLSRKLPFRTESFDRKPTPPLPVAAGEFLHDRLYFICLLCMVVGAIQEGAVFWLPLVFTDVLRLGEGSLLLLALIPFAKLAGVFLARAVLARLHDQVRKHQAESGKNLSEYMTSLITKFYEQEENTTMSNKRTIAFTVPEDIFLDFKEYLERNNLKQGLFLLNYIKRVLAEDAEAKSE